MSVKQHPTKGPGWWQIRIYKNRKDKYYTFEGTEAEAHALHAEMMGIPDEKDEQTLNDVMGRFISWYSLHRAKRSADDMETSIPRIIERIGNRPLSLLRQTDYDRYKRIRSEDGVKRRTVNIELSRLRALLSYAKNELGIKIGDWPKLYTKKQTAPPDMTPLSVQEISRLIDQLEGDKKTIVMLYAWCNLRRTEALTLQRKHIDFESGFIHVTGKGAKTRLVPIIGEELRERLKEACTHYPKMKRGKQIDPNDKVRPKAMDDYLFICARTGKPYTNIKKALKAAAVRAGIEKPVWNHLMRHSGATAAIGAGVGLRQLQAMLGHSDIRMTEIYTHMNADLLKKDALKLEEYHHKHRQKSNIIKSIKKEVS